MLFFRGEKSFGIQIARIKMSHYIYRLQCLHLSVDQEKLDHIKRPKTVGGKLVQLTPAEDLFLMEMEGRPQIERLHFGVDSDGIAVYSE